MGQNTIRGARGSTAGYKVRVKAEGTQHKWQGARQEHGSGDTRQAQPRQGNCPPVRVGLKMSKRHKIGNREAANAQKGKVGGRWHGEGLWWQEGQQGRQAVKGGKQSGNPRYQAIVEEEIRVQAGIWHKKSK